MVRTTKNRQAFTLVELLVAMTLTIFVMVILTQAFVAGLDTFRGLKAIGDMQENLRVATSNLRADLTQDHFDGKRQTKPGAFFAGMILGETPLSRRAAEETLPLRDAFAVLFFVSVGMLFDPYVLIEQPLALLATVIIIIVA